MWSAKAFLLPLLLIRRKQLVAAGGGSETDQVNQFLCLPGQNKSVGLEVFLLVSLKNKQKKHEFTRACASVCARFFRSNAQLPPRDLANETGVMQQEWSRRRQHEWKPNGVRRRLQGLIWRVAAAAGRRGDGGERRGVRAKRAVGTGRNEERGWEGLGGVSQRATKGGREERLNGTPCHSALPKTGINPIIARKNVWNISPHVCSSMSSAVCVRVSVCVRPVKTWETH